VGVPAPPGDGATEGGGLVDPAPEPTCRPDQPFGEVHVVAGLAAAAPAVSGVGLSPDYRLAYFQADGRADSAGYDDVYQATRSALTSPFGDVRVKFSS